MNSVILMASAFYAVALILVFSNNKGIARMRAFLKRLASPRKV